MKNRRDQRNQREAQMAFGGDSVDPCCRGVVRGPVLSVLLFVALTGSSVACSIPVFRYALERWKPDLYEVLVFHRGPLTDEQQQLAGRFAPDRVPGRPLPNSSLALVDLDGKVRPEFAAIWSEEEAGAKLPWVVVRTPWRGQNETVWSGALTAKAVDSALISPKRLEVAKRLLAGDSVVFLCLNGPDKEQNDRLFSLAEQEFARMEREIKLPEIQEEDLNKLTVAPDKIGLKFSFLRIDRDDPREQLTVRAMLSVEPKLKSPTFAADPMLFPVFGRGRVFFPLVGSEMKKENLEDLGRFLAGACQCTVKEQNPGIDLLTTIDWGYFVEPTFDGKPPPPLSGLAGFADFTSNANPSTAGSNGAAERAAATSTESVPLARDTAGGEQEDPVDRRPSGILIKAQPSDSTSPATGSETSGAESPQGPGSDKGTASTSGPTAAASPTAPPADAASATGVDPVTAPTGRHPTQAAGLGDEPAATSLEGTTGRDPSVTADANTSADEKATSGQISLGTTTLLAAAGLTVLVIAAGVLFRGR